MKTENCKSIRNLNIKIYVPKEDKDMANFQINNTKTLLSLEKTNIILGFTRKHAECLKNLSGIDKFEKILPIISQIENTPKDFFELINCQDKKSLRILLDYLHFILTVDDEIYQKLLVQFKTY